MNLLKNTPLLFLILFSCSYPESKNIDIEIQNCLKNRLEENSGFNLNYFFSHIKRVEDVFLEKKILLKNNKKEYIRMIEKFDRDKNISKGIYAKIDAIYSDIIDFNPSDFQHTYKHCMINVLSSNRESDYLTNALKAFDEIQSSGYSDFKPLKRIVSLTNFENEKSRLLLCDLLCVYIWNQNNN